MTTLTEITLRNLKPPARGQTTCMDDSLTGFGVRVSQGGTKTFTLLYGPSRQRITIGRYPTISLSSARQRARELLAEFTLGRTTPRTIRFNEAVELFLADHSKRNRPRTIKDYTRVLTTRFPFGDRRLADITAQDISRRIDKLEATPTERNYAIVIIKMLFRWAARKHFVKHSPCEGLMTSKRTSRSRVLSHTELKSIWQACEGAFGDVVKLLILTGQRRGEIAALEDHFVDLDKIAITLPETLCKNGREHRFPIGENAVSILRSVLVSRRPDKTTFLFPARGNPHAPFSGWSKSKIELDKRCGVENWVLHDLRRTFATNLAALEVPPHVVERLLNHSSGTISGVAAIYNRHGYMDEMREAIKKWEKKLKTLTASLRRVA
ncbi:MAG: site-specific integrase [Rhizobiales bacterium]|nr:site-specific integrase [Hyphomicrobiales bacterium]